MRHPLLALLASASAAVLVASCASSGNDDGATPSPTATGTGTWSSRTPMTAARQETAVVALDGEIVVIGGFTATGAVVATVEAFDPATDGWRALADLPVPMHHANAAVTTSGRLFVTGFLTGLGFTEDGRVYEYDAALDEWNERAAMPAGTERGSSGVAAVGSRIYVMGGLRGGAVSDVSVFDAGVGSNGAWTSLQALPAPRDHLAAGAIDGIVYIAGGRDGTIDGHTAEVYAFDPDVGNWTARSPMPTSRGGVASAVLDGRLYVFGGEGNPDDPSGVFADAEAFDPATNTWEVLAPMTTPRHGTGAAAANGSLFVPGGADEEAFAAVSTHEAFTPAP